MEYGTVPDWLAGVGTVGALVVALVLLSHDRRARREVEEERRRAQASRVVCWLEAVEVLTPVGDRRVELVLHNGSEEPVFDCRVHVDLDAAATSTFRDGGRRLTLAEPMLPPGQTRRPLSLPVFDLPHASAGMAFTDTSNRRWGRGHNGRLSQLVDDST